MGTVKHSKIDKTSRKQSEWISRTARALHISEETAKHLLAIERHQSVRINTIKISEKDALMQLKSLGWTGKPFVWASSCYTVESGLEAIRDSDLVADGMVYIQNAASWLPVLALDPHAGESVLDICAAPGGKTSHIATLTANEAYITANDNSRPRLAKLRSNLDRLGVQNVTYTLFDATQLTRKLEDIQFDKILLDAPCSGEGMMTIGSSKDFASWSVAHIKRLQQLQKKLIVQAWQLLKPGGTLVYSTCTMAPEENEAVVDYLLRKNPDAWLQQMKFDLPNRVPPVTTWNDKDLNDQLKFSMRLVPSPEIEAFFVAKIHKQNNNLDNIRYSV